MPESQFISLAEATKYCRYSQEYLSLRARQGKLRALKFGRNWVTKKEWLKEYLGKVEEYNNSVAEKKVKVVELPKELARVIEGATMPTFGLRFGFVAALALVLLTGGLVFGKDSFQQVVADLVPLQQQLAKELDRGLAQTAEISEQTFSDTYIFTVFTAQTAQYTLDTFKEFGLWLTSQTFELAQDIKQKLGGLTQTITDSAKKIAQAPTKLLNLIKQLPQTAKDKLVSVKHLVFDRPQPEPTPETITEKEIIREIVELERITQIEPIKEITRELITIDDRSLQDLANLQQRFAQFQTQTNQELSRRIAGVNLAPTVGVAGAESITTLGAITQGDWNAGTISVEFGGTGLKEITQGWTLMGQDANKLQATSTLFISQDGKVGIGTTTPDQLLTIQGNFFTQAADDSIGLFYDSTNNRVGIGTTSPDTQLNLVQAANGQTMFKIRRATDASPTGDFLQYTSADGATNLFRVDNSGNLTGGSIILSGSQTITSTSEPQLRVQYDASNEITFDTNSVGTTTISVAGTSPKLVFRPSVTNLTDTFQFQAVNETTVLNIDTSNLRVGIGTTTPQGIFHVATGTVDALVVDPATGNVGIGTTSPSALLDLFRPSSGNIFAISSTTAGDLVTIDNSGNVGIGDTTPAALLTVGSGDLFQVDSSGRVLLPAGALGAGTLALSFTGDTDSGFYSSGADEVSLALGGSRIYRFRTTTLETTATKLSLEGVTALIATGNGLGKTLTLQSGAQTAGENAIFLQTYAADALTFTNRVVITGREDTADIQLLNSNVGIGTTAPVEKLDIVGNLILGQAPTTYSTTSEDITAASTTIPVTSTTDYPTAGTILIGSEAITYTGKDATNFTGAARGALGTTAAASTANTTVKNYLFTAVATSTTPRMVITGEGNVGIGTTGPSEKLHLRADTGDIGFFMDSASGNAVLTLHSGASGTDLKRFQMLSVNGDFILRSRLDSGGNPGGTAPFGSGNFYIATKNTATGLVDAQAWGTAGLERMRIDSAGNVGIGTTSPAYGTEITASSTAGYFGVSGSASGDVLVVDATGNVGIGTSSPAALLDVFSDNSSATGLFRVATGTTEALFVDTAGNVGIGVTAPFGSVKLQVVGVIAAAAGTAGNPGIIFKEEGTSEDSGFFSPGTNLIGISTNGQERVRIDSTGNVGIGTTTPAYGTEITASSTAGYFGISGSASGDVFIVDASGRVGIGTSSLASMLDIFSNSSSASSLFRIATGTTEALFVDGAGNVGIGTTSPTSLLHVNNSGAAGADSRTATFNYSGITGRGISLGLDASNISTISGIVDGANSSSLKLRTKNAGTIIDAITIDGPGNVGIGTTSPSATLHVNDSSSPYAPSLWVGTPFGSGTAELFVGNTAGDVKNYGIHIWNDVQAGPSYIDNRYNGSTSDTGNFIRFRQRIVASETMRDIMSLTYSGNVGIGTTSPAYGTEITASSTAGYFGISGSASGDVFIVDASGRVGIGTSSLASMLDIFSNSSSASSLFRIATGTTEALFVDGAGNVGIGTVSPVAPLEVKGDGALLTVTATAASAADPILEVDASARTNEGIAILKLRGRRTADGLNAGNIQFLDGSNVIGNIIVNRASADGKGDMIFRTSGANERMRIDENGNVGIGTTAPVEKLDIVGNLILGQAPTTYSTTSEDITAASTIIPVTSTTDYPTAGTILIGSEAITYTGKDATNFTGATRGALGTTAAASTANTTVKNYLLTTMATSTAPRMVITGEGNVGIGTTNPTSKLHIALDAGTIPANAAGIAGLFSNTDTTTDNTQVSIISGDTGIASLRFGDTGDADEGGILWINGAGDVDRMDFHVRGTQMSIESGGNVGIGTTSPAYGTEITASSTAGYFGVSGSASGDVFIVDAAGRVGIGTSSLASVLDIFSNSSSASSLFRIATGTTEALFVDGAGNVGIGTTGPDTLLDIYRNDTNVADGNLRLANAGTGDAFIEFIIPGANNYAFGIDNSDSDKLKLQAGSANLDSGTNALTITTAGDVGIGTTSPATKLHVFNASSGGTADTGNQITAENSADAGIQILSGASNLGRLMFGDSGLNYAGEVRYDHSVDKLSFHTAGTQKVTIDTSGNIGIGTTSPGSLLHVFQAGSGDIAQFSNATGTQMLLKHEGLVDAAAGPIQVCIDNTTKILYKGASATTCDPSSLRYKNNITDYEGGLTSLNQLRPVSFYFNGDQTDQRIGFIAEEVFKVDARLVQLNQQGLPDALRLGDFLPVITKAIQELDLKVEDLATTTEPAPNSFADRFFKALFSRIKNWLADTANGITSVFAKTFQAEEQICVDGECLTADDIRALKSMTGGGASSSSGGSSGSASTQPSSSPSVDSSTQENTSEATSTQETATEEPTSSATTTEPAPETPLEPSDEGLTGQAEPAPVEEQPAGEESGSLPAEESAGEPEPET